MIRNFLRQCYKHHQPLEGGIIWQAEDFHNDLILAFESHCSWFKKIWWAKTHNPHGFNKVLKHKWLWFLIWMLKVCDEQNSVVIFAFHLWHLKTFNLKLGNAYSKTHGYTHTFSYMVSSRTLKVFFFSNVRWQTFCPSSWKFKGTILNPFVGVYFSSWTLESSIARLSKMKKPKWMSKKQNI